MKNRACFGNIGRAFIILVICLSGCSTTPMVKYYILSGMQVDISETVASETITIGLGPVEFPKFLDRPQIVTRESQNRVVMSEFHRWAGSFPEDFLRVLGRNLSMLLPTDQVVVHPWTDQFSPAGRILLTVEQFDGCFVGGVVLDVTWSFLNQKSAKALVRKHALIKEPLADKNYESLVAAQSRAIATLSHAIVNEIGDKLIR